MALRNVVGLMYALVHDLAGQTFGRLHVIEYAGTSASREAMWHVVCECGTHRWVAGRRLEAGHTRSCGCLRAKTQTRHGAAVGGVVSPEYKSWSHAKDRCTNPRNRKWSNYGGRGIRMAEEWLNDFGAFFAHVGPRPGPGYSIDRINNDGDYVPGNVRWADHKQQANNRRPRSIR